MNLFVLWLCSVFLCRTKSRKEKRMSWGQISDEEFWYFARVQTQLLNTSRVKLWYMMNEVYHGCQDAGLFCWIYRNAKKKKKWWRFSLNILFDALPHITQFVFISLQHKSGLMMSSKATIKCSARIFKYISQKCVLKNVWMWCPHFIFNWGMLRGKWGINEANQICVLVIVGPEIYFQFFFTTVFIEDLICPFVCSHKDRLMLLESQLKYFALCFYITDIWWPYGVNEKQLEKNK